MKMDWELRDNILRYLENLNPTTCLISEVKKYYIEWNITNADFPHF